MSEWIEWKGGECPVYNDTLVDVKFRSGQVHECFSSDYWDWRWWDGRESSEIVAYRLSEEEEDILPEPSRPAPEMPEVKPPKGIGDVASDAKGAGARYNAGKTPLELIPLRLIVEERRHTLCVGKYAKELKALEALAKFQEGGSVDNLLDAIQAIGSQWDECAAVFDYGKRKYAEWNWAKGMPWSVPIACAARHILYGVMQGEENDKESGLPHRGHFICNIVMLWTYVHTYKEGDDRPKMWLSGLNGEME
jgi:hypothetical protein